MNAKKRLIFGVLFGLTIFGAVAGSAASLGGITSDGLGADATIVAACDANGVGTDYTTAYNTTGSASYKVATVVVTGLDHACDGDTIEVNLTGAADASLESVSKTVEVDPVATTTTLTFGSTTVAENVTGVHIVISG